MHRLLPLIACYLSQANSPNKRRELAWDHEGIAAFERVKSALADLAVLSFPMRGVETILMCDASDVAVGSALNQVIDGEFRLNVFFSKALTKTQKKNYLQCL